MKSTTGSYLLVSPIILVIIMAFTRVNHFGSAFSLPDASLAVFFLAGLCFSRLWFLVVLFFGAGVLDYWAISPSNVSDFCLTPAYFCLIPTYTTMWLAGRYSKVFKSLHFIESVKIFGLAAITTLISFIISNGSFYVWSGSFGELAWDKYVNQFNQYLPSYLSGTLGYIVIGLVAINIFKATKILAVLELKIVKNTN